MMTRTTTTLRGRLVAATLAVATLVTGCATGSAADSQAQGDAGSAPANTPDGTEAGQATVDAAARPSPGCDLEEPAGPVGTDVPVTVPVDGTERRYLLTVPDDPSGQPLPLVFDFHGLMEGSEIHSRMTRYSELAGEERFVAVLPEGAGDPLHWELGRDASSNPDLRFFDTMLDQLAGDLCIDLARVYATGLSNGAMFTSLLICERSEVLAAAAPVAGLTELPGCTYEAPVPIVTFHGTADPILLFNGGVDTSAIPGMDTGGSTTGANPVPEADLDGEGYPAAVRAFAERNGCDAEPADTNVSEEVVHRVYECPDGAEVEFYIVLGGGHSWPASEFSASIGDIVGPTTFDIDATRDGWEFLSSHASS